MVLVEWGQLCKRLQEGRIAFNNNHSLVYSA
jgi:hypothetical protein